MKLSYCQPTNQNIQFKGNKQKVIVNFPIDDGIVYPKECQVDIGEIKPRKSLNIYECNFFEKLGGLLQISNKKPEKNTSDFILFKLTTGREKTAISNPKKIFAINKDILAPMEDAKLKGTPLEEGEAIKLLNGMCEKIAEAALPTIQKLFKK